MQNKEIFLENILVNAKYLQFNGEQNAMMTSTNDYSSQFLERTEPGSRSQHKSDDDIPSKPPLTDKQAEKWQGDHFYWRNLVCLRHTATGEPKIGRIASFRGFKEWECKTSTGSLTTRPRYIYSGTTARFT